MTIVDTEDDGVPEARVSLTSRGASGGEDGPIMDERVLDPGDGRGAGWLLLLSRPGRRPGRDEP